MDLMRRRKRWFFGKVWRSILL